MAVVEPLATWNDKYLDYEIETHVLSAKRVVILRMLETTSTSITRLKLNEGLFCLLGQYAWNDKYLDYEIETCSGSGGSICS